MKKFELYDLLRYFHNVKKPDGTIFPILGEDALALTCSISYLLEDTNFCIKAYSGTGKTVLMEAMACGCAIVSTDNCMIPEIVNHGENGLLANTPEELREHCEYLLNDPDEARRLGDNAKATIINEFNLDRFVEGWNKQFFNVIKNYRK